MTHIALNKIKNILTNKGQGMLEYVLIIGLIAIAVIASFPPLGKILADKFTSFVAALSS
jgi:Flp pilus assembly pilin Flp